MLEVKIIDDEEYEKNKTFIIQLGEPILLEIGQKHGREKFLFNQIQNYFTLLKLSTYSLTGINGTAEHWNSRYAVMVQQTMSYKFHEVD